MCIKYCLLAPWNRVLENLIIAHLVKLLAFMEPEGLLLFSQEPTTSPYHQPTIQTTPSHPVSKTEVSKIIGSWTNMTHCFYIIIFTVWFTWPADFTIITVIRNCSYHFDYCKEVKFRKELVQYWPKVHPKWDQKCVSNCRITLLWRKGLVLISQEIVVYLLVEMMDVKLWMW